MESSATHFERCRSCLDVLNRSSTKLQLQSWASLRSRCERHRAGWSSLVDREGVYYAAPDAQGHSAGRVRPAVVGCSLTRAREGGFKRLVKLAATRASLCPAGPSRSWLCMRGKATRVLCRRVAKGSVRARGKETESQFWSETKASRGGLILAKPFGEHSNCRPPSRPRDTQLICTSFVRLCSSYRCTTSSMRHRSGQKKTPSAC